MGIEPTYGAQMALARLIGIKRTELRQNFFCHVAVDVRQPEVTSLVAV